MDIHPFLSIDMKCYILYYFKNNLGGFIPKNSPASPVYISDKFRTTTEHVTEQHPNVHFNEPVVAHQPVGSGKISKLNE